MSIYELYINDYHDCLNSLASEEWGLFILEAIDNVFQ